MKLCCTSVMLPRWTLDETFDKLGAFGYEALELRCRFNPEDSEAEPAFWGRHLSDVSPDNVVDKAEQIQAAEARSGVKVVALAPNCPFTETDTIRKLFAGACAINPDNPPMVRIGGAMHDRTQPYLPQFQKARQAYTALVELAREYGVKILYEIHVGTVAVSASRTGELLRDLDPDHIGAIWDVPNMIRGSIEDSRLGLEVLGPYLAHCHIGNAILVAGDRDAATGHVPWAWEFCDVREGAANIPQIIQDLKDVGYDGALSLEEFGSGDDAEKVREQGAWLKGLMRS